MSCAAPIACREMGAAGQKLRGRVCTAWRALDEIHRFRGGTPITDAPYRPIRIALALTGSNPCSCSQVNRNDVAGVGDEIELREPIGGHFVWDVSDGGPLLLIGGGSGVVPLMSMVRHRACQESRIPFLLLFSVRTYDDILFREELLTLYARHDGFALALALTRDTPKHGEDFGLEMETIDILLESAGFMIVLLCWIAVTSHRTP